jgi:hypothetical protein
MVSLAQWKERTKPQGTTQAVEIQGSCPQLRNFAFSLEIYANRMPELQESMSTPSVPSTAHRV